MLALACEAWTLYVEVQGGMKPKIVDLTCELKELYFICLED